MTEFIQVFTTAGGREEAERISHEVVAQRAAACGQVIGPVMSTYWWEGKLENSEEWLCLFKTTTGNFHEIERVIRDKHSYEVPEILAVPVTVGSEDYLSWLEKETKSG